VVFVLRRQSHPIYLSSSRQSG